VSVTDGSYLKSNRVANASDRRCERFQTGRSVGALARRPVLREATQVKNIWTPSGE
jgi:hypothetical protein